MRYLEGEWLAVAAAGGGALLPPDFPPATALDLLDDLQQGAAFSVVLQHLVSASGASLTNLPEFAVAVREDADMHIALRGPLRLTGRTAAGDVDLTGQDVTTWHEERVAEATGLRLLAVAAGPNERAVWWPVDGGIVWAGALELVASPAEEAPPAVEEVAPTDAPPVPLPPIPLPPVEESVPPVEESVPPSPPDDAVDPVHTGNTTLVADDDADDDASLHSTTFFADMFADPVPASDAPVPTPAEATPVEQDDHDGMTVTSFAVEEDHAGQTVFSPDPVAAPQPSPLSAAPVAGPTVLARICQACGTANPTQKVACRACGTPLTGDAIRIPRPPLGTIMLPSHELMAIEHPVVVGRRPEVSRFSTADVPVVVKVDDRHISSTHLKIDLEDWSVLVTNLGLNGTILRRPGQPDRGMGDGETVLAQVDDVYDIGSGAALTIVELA